MVDEGPVHDAALQQFVGLRRRRLYRDGIQRLGDIDVDAVGRGEFQPFEGRDVAHRNIPRPGVAGLGAPHRQDTHAGMFAGGGEERLMRAEEGHRQRRAVGREKGHPGRRGQDEAPGREAMCAERHVDHAVAHEFELRRRWRERRGGIADLNAPVGHAGDLGEPWQQRLGDDGVPRREPVVKAQILCGSRAGAPECQQQADHGRKTVSHGASSPLHASVDKKIQNAV